TFHGCLASEVVISGVAAFSWSQRSSCRDCRPQILLPAGVQRDPPLALHKCPVKLEVQAAGGRVPVQVPLRGGGGWTACLQATERLCYGP
ncbi:28S ribosomal protein S24-A, partial [Huso huso]